jgi:hypothetical protein
MSKLSCDCAQLGSASSPVFPRHTCQSEVGSFAFSDLLNDFKLMVSNHQFAYLASRSAFKFPKAHCRDCRQNGSSGNES